MERKLRPKSKAIDGYLRFRKRRAPQEDRTLKEEEGFGGLELEISQAKARREGARVTTKKSELKEYRQRGKSQNSQN